MSALARSFAIFFLGGLLGFLALAPLPSFGWDFDYSFSADKALRGDWVQVWRSIGLGDAHPPLYYLAFRAWMSLGGHARLDSGVSDAAIAWSYSLSLLGFVFLSGALALASWDLLGPWGAMGALGLLFLFEDAPWAPLLRMYPWAALWVLLGAWGYLRGQVWAGSLAGTLGLYTHYLTGIALLPFALYALARSGRRALLGFTPYLLFSFWAPYLLWQVQHGRANPDIRPEPEALFKYLWFKWPPDLLLLLLLVGGVGLALNRAYRERFLPVLLLPVASLYVWYFSSLWLNTVLIRYLFVFAPLVSLGAAAALAWLPSLARWSAALLLLGVGLPLARYNHPYLPWEDLTAHSRLAARYLDAGMVDRFLIDPGTRFSSFLVHMPGEKRLEEISDPLVLLRYCTHPRPLLAWEYRDQRPEASQVRALLGCWKGRVRRLDPMPPGVYHRGSLYLLLPEGISEGQADRERAGLERPRRSAR